LRHAADNRRSSAALGVRSIAAEDRRASGIPRPSSSVHIRHDSKSRSALGPQHPGIEVFVASCIDVFHDAHCDLLLRPLRSILPHFSDAGNRLCVVLRETGRIHDRAFHKDNNREEFRTNLGAWDPYVFCCPTLQYY
ncbi:hypothetical protein PMAYCL1PPCAC_00614, partial [Pristionchus mayeri]